jgi:hypothetical protein
LFYFNYLHAKKTRNGGWGGIRTHETLSRLLVFKTSAFNRSATHPHKVKRFINLDSGIQEGLGPVKTAFKK